ncbi:MAG TPA: protein kinase [Thermoanaerobaculia bacterium]|nr:protein kinase [Thermoanaerobaculia bacterium]
MNILRIGRYRVLERLGGGASAEVYLAEDSVIPRKVALKVLHREADPSHLRRFEREVWCNSLLNHPNVVTVFDVGRHEDTHYMASEYVEGETLRTRLDHGALSIREAVDVAAGVARALVAAHEAWVVHRDIKPENIMIRRDGGIKVLDFSVAIQTAGGETQDPLARPDALVGTLHYLSPEQVRGEPIIDTRSDLYSLGVVLYETVARHRPFAGESPLDVLAMIVEGEPDPLPESVPLALRSIILRAMQKSIWSRFQTAQEMLDELDDFRLDLTLWEKVAAKPN